MIATVKKSLLTLLILISSAIIGSLLLILVYCLPTDRMAQNIASGAETLLHEGATFEYAYEYKSAILDNVTDAIMLSEVISITPPDPIKDAMNVPRYIYSGESSSPELSLMAYLNNNTETERFVTVYPRYWHGYLIFLKPFFYLFDFADSRIFHLSFQLILIVILILLFVRQKLSRFILPLTLLLILWNPASTGMCIQYYACFYVSFLSMIIMLWKKEFLNKNNFYYHIFFLVIGICTSYFDFLTYPIATLGLPLCIWMIISHSKISKPLQLITNCCFWAVGYLGMWAEKWILSSLLLKENILSDALSNITSRTSTTVDATSISRIGTVFYLIRPLIKWPYVIFFGLPMIYIIIVGLKRIFTTHLHPSKDNYVMLMLFALIALIPCAWFFVAANHSYVHPRLVYRNWGVSLFALFSGIINFFSEDLNIKFGKHSKS